jgi:hypothetical protein
MRQIVINHNDDYAAPVLITEKAMRRATESYINTNTKNNSTGFGDYINETGFVRHSNSAKIWVSFRQEGMMIYIEKSCDYEPEYLHQEVEP